MNGTPERDVEKTCPIGEFVASSRRPTDAREHGQRLEIAIVGERISLPARAICSIEHERQGASEEIEFQIKWENPQ